MKQTWYESVSIILLLFISNFFRKRTLSTSIHCKLLMDYDKLYEITYTLILLVLFNVAVLF